MGVDQVSTMTTSSMFSASSVIQSVLSLVAWDQRLLGYLARGHQMLGLGLTFAFVAKLKFVRVILTSRSQKHR